MMATPSSGDRYPSRASPVPVEEHGIVRKSSTSASFEKAVGPGQREPTRKGRFHIRDLSGTPSNGTAMSPATLLSKSLPNGNIYRLGESDGVLPHPGRHDVKSDSPHVEPLLRSHTEGDLKGESIHSDQFSGPSSHVHSASFGGTTSSLGLPPIPGGASEGAASGDISTVATTVAGGGNGSSAVAVNAVGEPVERQRGRFRVREIRDVQGQGRWQGQVQGQSGAPGAVGSSGDVALVLVTLMEQNKMLLDKVSAMEAFYQQYPQHADAHRNKGVGVGAGGGTSDRKESPHESGQGQGNSAHQGQGQPPRRPSSTGFSRSDSLVSGSVGSSSTGVNSGGSAVNSGGGVVPKVKDDGTGRRAERGRLSTLLDQLRDEVDLYAGIKKDMDLELKRVRQRCRYLEDKAQEDKNKYAAIETKLERSKAKNKALGEENQQLRARLGQFQGGGHMQQEVISKNASPLMMASPLGAAPTVQQHQQQMLKAGLASTLQLPPPASTPSPPPSHTPQDHSTNPSTSAPGVGPPSLGKSSMQQGQGMWKSSNQGQGHGQGQQGLGQGQGMGQGHRPPPGNADKNWSPRRKSSEGVNVENTGQAKGMVVHRRGSVDQVFHSTGSHGMGGGQQSVKQQIMHGQWHSQHGPGLVQGQGQGHMHGQGQGHMHGQGHMQGQGHLQGHMQGQGGGSGMGGGTNMMYSRQQMPKNNHARSAGAGGPHEHMIGNQNQHQSHSQQHQRVSSVDGMGPPQHLRKSSMSESMKYTTAPGTSTGGMSGGVTVNSGVVGGGVTGSGGGVGGGGGGLSSSVGSKRHPLQGGPMGLDDFAQLAPFSTAGTAGSGSGAGGGGGANNALGMSRNSTGASTVQSQGATSHGQGHNQGHNQGHAQGQHGQVLGGTRDGRQAAIMNAYGRPSNGGNAGPGVSNTGTGGSGGGGGGSGSGGVGGGELRDDHGRPQSQGQGGQGHIHGSIAGQGKGMLGSKKYIGLG